MNTAAGTLPPEIVGVKVPPTAHDDMPFIRALLEQQAEEYGCVLYGEPTVSKFEPAWIEVGGEKVYPFGDDPIYRAECKVRSKLAPVDAPTFIPSSQAVEAAARAVHAKYGTKSWDEIPAVVRNQWATVALDLLVAAGPYLIGDALLHLRKHGDLYGLTVPEDGALVEDLERAARDLAESQRHE